MPTGSNVKAWGADADTEEQPPSLRADFDPDPDPPLPFFFLVCAAAYAFTSADTASRSTRATRSLVVP